MPLFNRKKQQQNKNTKYLVNIKDKKYRQYLEERFNSLVSKEDWASFIGEMQWEKIKNRIDNLPPRRRMKMLQAMIKNIDKLEPDVRANLERYVNERMGIKIGN